MKIRHKIIYLLGGVPNEYFYPKVAECAHKGLVTVTDRVERTHTYCNSVNPEFFKEMVEWDLARRLALQIAGSGLMRIEQKEDPETMGLMFSGSIQIMR